MKVIIFGGRDFNDYDYLKKSMDELCEHGLRVDTVISGKARGADTLGERWARENNIPIISKAADWDTFGKRAGWIRNNEMADIADAGVGFNGGRGTQMMFDILAQRGLLAIDMRF